jgi:hypothetical protein
MYRITIGTIIINTIGYDPVKQVLEVDFHLDGTYCYKDVPRKTFDNLMAASSKSDYFRDQIDPNYNAEVGPCAE